MNNSFNIQFTLLRAQEYFISLQSYCNSFFPVALNAVSKIPFTVFQSLILYNRWLIVFCLMFCELCLEPCMHWTSTKPTIPVRFLTLFDICFISISSLRIFYSTLRSYSCPKYSQITLIFLCIKL